MHKRSVRQHLHLLALLGATALMLLSYPAASRGEAATTATWRLFLPTVFNPAGSSPCGVGPGYKTDEVVVRLNPASGATIAAINAAYGTTQLDTLGIAPGIYRLRVAAGANSRDVAQAMAGDLRLLFAEPHVIGKAPEADPSGIKSWGGNDPAPLASQYALGQINLAAGQQVGRGAGAVVALIDSGAQLDHPALAGKLTAARYDFVEGDADPSERFDGADNDGDGLVDEGAGHGTHVAGIVRLVAPDAQIMPLRALDSEGNGEFFAVAEAIEYATQQGASVINLSLGSVDRSDLLRDVIREATLRGVVVVAAAGNLGSDVAHYPAADQCVISVTSVGAAATKSPFANYGSWVTLAAPGESIYSAFPPSGYAWWSGTSMAAPFVAGQSALLKGLRPDLNARNVAALIGETARPLVALDSGGEDLGGGLVDVGASLSLLAGGQVPDRGGGRISSSCVGE